MDFTVILEMAHRFGDDETDRPIDTDREHLGRETAISVGAAKDFPFTCPRVAPEETAVLQFRSLGVTVKGILRVNEIDITDALTRDSQLIVHDGTRALWNTHLVLIPANTLAEENVLHIAGEKVKSLSVFSPPKNFDDFIIDNAVVFFKTQMI